MQEARAERHRQNAIKYHHKHRDKILASWKQSRRTNPAIHLVRLAAQRAKRRSLPFQLKTEDIEVPELCPVLGIPLKVQDGTLSANSPTLDRLHPELGYVPGNVVVVSYKANRIKNNATVVELERLLQFYKDPHPPAELHPRSKEWAKKMWVGRRQYAKQKSLPFIIAPEDIQVPLVCPVLLLELHPNEGGRGPKPNSPTVDRIDNKEGYIPSNIVVVSAKANRIKNDGNLDDLEKVLCWCRSLA